MKKTIATMLTVLFLSGCNFGTNYVDIKYRDDDIDVSDQAFEYLDTSKSSWVGGAWYDENKEYMVIELEGVYYHYCSMPDSAWENFSEADSFGSYYRAEIRGDYDCRLGVVPSYN